ncbi:hypothetical protein LTR36_009498 [Oleoguttula mirabilis]|uniref:Chitin-binding type-1 domain-containing protein n=1 Tax=Oleoguttula mirabilis TaxID=1507867 RepID=A0AAV9JVH1_9PEZI|nr:hypothetical protein LTR36_009498 [Oleoguttula mirabilis]
MPTLTLKHPETVQFWNITTSFCRVIDSVSYVSTTNIKPPVLTKHELGFKPMFIPKDIKPRAVIAPYYVDEVTTEPAFHIGVAPGAEACPMLDYDVSTDGKCGPGAKKRCPSMQCCSAVNECGTDSLQCFGGCQHEYGSCWANKTAGFLQAIDVFPEPSSSNTMPILPPDQGRGVEFANWAFCWDCKSDGTLFAGAGGAGGFLGLKFGWGFGGGGCFLIIFCPPDFGRDCVLGNCDGSSVCRHHCRDNPPKGPKASDTPSGDDPKSTKSSSDPKASDTPNGDEPASALSGGAPPGSGSGPPDSPVKPKCDTTTATDYTYSCYKQNATTYGSSTITAWSTCTETKSKVQMGCSITATTTAIYEEGPSCPSDINVSPDDDQGEDGGAPSCPYVGNVTVSITDDQGEDGSPPCELQGNVTVTDVVLLCNQMNNTAGTPTATSCFNSTTFRVTGTCLTNTTSTSIVAACPYKANISLEPVALSPTYAPMTAAPSLITYGFSASGNVLDCGGDVRRRKAGGDPGARDLAPVYCEWKPPTRSVTTITSFNGESGLAIADGEYGFIMSVLADRVNKYSAVDNLLSRLKNVKSLESYVTSMLAEEDGMLAMVSSISKKIAQQATQSDGALRSEISWLFTAIAVLEKAEKALEKTAQSLPLPISAVTTNNSVPSASLAAWIGSIGRAAKSLEGAIESAEARLVASEASAAEISALIARDTSLWAGYLPTPTAKCSWETPTNSTYGDCVLSKDALGSFYCPNQQMLVTDATLNSGPPVTSIDLFTWSGCVAPVSAGVGNCTLDIMQGINDATPSTICNCPHSADISTITICGSEIVCPNMVGVMTLIPSSFYSYNTESSNADCDPPSSSQYGSCNLFSYTGHDSSVNINCNCETYSTVEYGNTLLEQPTPTTICGKVQCPNSGPNWTELPAKKRSNGPAATADKVLSSDAAFEAARKGVRDYYVEMITTPATPGSTPEPMPRDTSTPPEPTTVMGVDGWAMAVNQGRQQTTTGSEQPEKTKAGASKVLERLLNFF